MIKSPFYLEHCDLRRGARLASVLCLLRVFLFEISAVSRGFVEERTSPKEYATPARILFMSNFYVPSLACTYMDTHAMKDACLVL